MLVKDVMMRDVTTVKRSTPLKEVLNIAKKFHSFPVLPVLEKENKLTGIVTLEGILQIFHPHPSHLAELLKTIPFLDEREEDFSILEIPPEAGTLFLVDDFMEKKFIAVEEDKTVEEARSLMKLHKQDRICVVDKAGKLVGLISLFDIIMGILKDKGIV